MYIKKGTSRVVVNVPAIGVVFKFPRIHVVVLFKNVRWMVVRRKWKRLYKVLTGSSFSKFTVSSNLFKGLIDNVSEYVFYIKTIHAFLQPTFVSVFGLFNIQKYGEPVEMSAESFFEQIRMLTNDDEDLYSDLHHFSSPSNYCQVRGHLRIVDYSSKAVQRIVRKYGRQIYDGFNLAYGAD